MHGTTMQSTATRGRLLVLAAALLWSTSGLFLKSPLFESLPHPQRGPMLACYRALFAAAILIPFVSLRAIRWRWELVPMVLAFAMMNVLFVTAMTRTTAAAAIFLQSTSIVWALLLGWVLLRERVDRGSLVAMVCALCGIAWIVVADWAGENFLGNLMALGAGASYAVVITCLRRLRDEQAAWLVALNHLVSGVVLLPWVLTFDVSLDASQWSLVALLGMLQMGVPYVLFARGVTTIRTQDAALLVLIEPILNPVWVWLCWGEEVELPVWIGGGLIVVGLASRYLLFPTRDPESVSKKSS